jgi:hypothetical protein
MHVAFRIRSAAILIFLALATVGVWGFTSAFLVQPQLHPGQSYPRYLGLATAPDLTELAVYASWAFVAAWFSFRFLPPAPRRLAVAFILLFYLFVRGTFFPFNLHSGELARQFLLATCVALAIILGVLLARRPTATI